MVTQRLWSQPLLHPQRPRVLHCKALLQLLLKVLRLSRLKLQRPHLKHLQRLPLQPLLPYKVPHLKALPQLLRVPRLLHLNLQHLHLKHLHLKHLHLKHWHLKHLLPCKALRPKAQLPLH